MSSSSKTALYLILIVFLSWLLFPQSFYTSLQIFQSVWFVRYKKLLHSSDRTFKRKQVETIAAEMFEKEQLRECIQQAKLLSVSQ